MAASDLFGSPFGANVIRTSGTPRDFHFRGFLLVHVRGVPLTEGSSPHLFLIFPAFPFIRRRFDAVRFRRNRVATVALARQKRRNVFRVKRFVFVSISTGCLQKQTCTIFIAYLKQAVPKKPTFF